MDINTISQMINFEPSVLEIVQKETDSELYCFRFEQEIKEHNWLNLDSFSGKIERETSNKIMIDGCLAYLENQPVRPLIWDLQTKLFPQGYLIYYCNYDSQEMTATIKVIKGKDQLDILTVQLTNGNNYDLSNREIAYQLRKWSELCSFTILGAETNWLDIQFKTLPEDLNAFAENVYQFCPDSLDQGYVGDGITEDISEEEIENDFEEQTPEKLVQYIQKYNNIFLWWD